MRGRVSPSCAVCVGCALAELAAEQEDDGTAQPCQAVPSPLPEQKPSLQAWLLKSNITEKSQT